MPDDDRSSLEPPRLFGRRRRPDRRRSSPSPAAAEPSEPSPTHEPQEPEATEETTQDAAESTRIDVWASPAASAATTEVEPEPEPQPEPGPVAVEPEPAAAIEPDPVTVEPEPATTIEPEFAYDEPEITADPLPEADYPDGLPTDRAGDPAPPSRRRLRIARGRTTRGPVDGRIAAAVVGLVSGGVLIGLVAAGVRGCTAVRGLDSCGTGPGFTLLIVIFVLSVVIGRLLLGLFGQPDPGSVSFLGLGLTAILVLVFLTDHLDQWWALALIPVISMLTMLASWWVNTKVVYVAEERRP